MIRRILIVLVLIQTLLLSYPDCYGLNITGVPAKDKTYLLEAEASDARSYSALDLKIKEIVRKYRAAGLSVTIVRKGKIEWTTSCGYADKERGILAGKDTVYRAASISKPVSNMVLMTLWDKGLVDIDRDIGSYLGFKVRNPNYPDKPITLRYLMTHTSSISDYGTYNGVTTSSAPYPSLSEMLIPGSPAYSHKNFHKFAPGNGIFSYSNFGAGIMAAVVESVTKKRFSEYAREALFEKMNLDASFLPNDISIPDKIACIYSGDSLSYSRERALDEKNRISSIPIGQLYRLAQGNLYISSEDLAKLMIVIMGDGTYEGKRILSAQAVHMMNDIQWSGSSGHDKMRGLNITITDDMVKGRRLWGHQGRAYGSTAEMFYDINDKSGVVYLSNGSIDKTAPNGFTSIGCEIVNASFDAIR